MLRQVDPDLMDRLRDDRGNRVVFLSHCLLDENVRYLGGAFHSGAPPGTADLLASGVGICQLPCPEQRAWGGVRKPAMMAGYGLRDSPLYRVRRPLFRLFLLHTRVRYWLLARQVAREISQYQQAGVQITAVVGVGGSPSCGVNTTLDTGRAFERLAGCPLANIDRREVNGCVAESCVAGEGLFIAALRSRLHKRGITPPFLEHDLIAEMQGTDQTLALDQTIREATLPDARGAPSERERRR